MKKRTNVASFTDAWIETIPWDFAHTMFTVASFTDAWIETTGVLGFPAAL